MAQGAPGIGSQGQPPANAGAAAPAPEPIYRGSGGLLTGISAQILNYQAQKRQMLQQQQWQRQAAQVSATVQEQIAKMPETAELVLAREQMKEIEDANFDKPGTFTDDQVAIAARRLDRRMGEYFMAANTVYANGTMSAPDNPFVQQAMGNAGAELSENFATYQASMGDLDASIARLEEQAGELGLRREVGAQERLTQEQRTEAESRLMAEEAAEQRRGRRLETDEQLRQQRAQIRMAFEEDPNQRIALVQGIAEAMGVMEAQGFSSKVIDAAIGAAASKVGLDVGELRDEAKQVGKVDRQARIRELQTRQRQATDAGNSERAAYFQTLIDEQVEQDQLEFEEQQRYEEFLADQPMGTRAALRLMDATVSAAYTAAGLAAVPFQFAAAIGEEVGQAITGVATAAEAGQEGLPTPRPVSPERVDQEVGLRQRARQRLQDVPGRGLAE